MIHYLLESPRSVTFVGGDIYFVVDSFCGSAEIFDDMAKESNQSIYKVTLTGIQSESSRANLLLSMFQHSSMFFHKMYSR